MEDPWNPGVRESLLESVSSWLPSTKESTPSNDQNLQMSSNPSLSIDPSHHHPIDHSPPQRSRRKRKAEYDIQDYVDDSSREVDTEKKWTPSISEEKRLKQQQESRERNPISPEDYTESTQLKDLVSPQEYQAFLTIRSLVRKGKHAADKELISKSWKREFGKKTSQILSIMLASTYRVSKEPGLRRQFSSNAVDLAKSIIKQKRLEINERIRMNHPEEFKLSLVVERANNLLHRRKRLLKKASLTDSE